VRDAGLRQRQRAGVVDRVEGLRSGLAQDASDVDHGIDAVEQGVPVGDVLRLREVAVAFVRSARE
jgi:hypothetical protein